MKKRGNINAVLVAILFLIIYVPLLFADESGSKEIQQNLTNNGKEKKKTSHPKVNSVLIELEDEYKKGGEEAAKAFAKKNDITIKEGNKIRVVLVIYPISAPENYLNHERGNRASFYRTFLFQYGVEDVKNSGNRLQVEIPIDMIKKIGDEIEGIQTINLPDKRIIEHIKNKPQYEQEGIGNNGCFEVSRYVIEQKKLTKFGPCVEEEYEIDGERVYFINISIPTKMDCPSGCITAHYMGIVENSKITDYPDIREDFLNQKIHSSINQICDVNQPHTKYLVKVNNQYKWKVEFDEVQSYKWQAGFYEFQNRYCILTGYSIIHENDYNLSNLEGKYTELNCDNQEIAKAICLKNLIIRGGSCDSIQRGKNACLYLKADAERKLEICDQIGGDEELIDTCYYSLAIRLKDPNVCHLRQLSTYYDNNCERRIKEFTPQE